MSNSKLVEQLKLNYKFKSSNYVNNDQTNWFPIAETKPGVFVGITEENIWVVNGSAGLIPLDKTENFILGSLLIEKGYERVYKELRKLELSCEGNLDLIEVFPFVEIAKARLIDPSDYWLDLVLKWHDHFDEDQKKSLKVDFENIRNSKRLSQKARHKVKKVLKYLNRDNPVMRKQ
ncbi:hypothetical protein [Marinicella sp. W31]|uniref:hypothetical protein n=1 Tax=Marinicella sp. W31 TaxID=3023713 RepID=UPI00375760D2